MQLRERDAGLSFFWFLGTLWRFVVCHFGASWSAFWYARVGAALHRLLHRILWGIEHFAWVYVDDTLLVLKESQAAESTCFVLMLFSSLGVPLSWHKIAQGPEITYLGLLINVAEGTMGLTKAKMEKFMQGLGSLKCHDRIDRRTVQSFVGGLQWASAVLPHLRPWLAAFYRCINAPTLASKRRVRINAAVIKASRLWRAALRSGPPLFPLHGL